MNGSISQRKFISKKMLKKIVTLPLIASACLITFIFCSGAGRSNVDVPRYDKILHAVAEILDNGHYSPKKINDQFSEKVFDEYINRLDPERLIFLQSDIQKLKSYYHSIDDELMGKPVKFFYAVNDIYKQRLTALNRSYASMLADPFDFSIPDSIVADYDKRVRPANAADQANAWKKKMKYITLEKFVDLQEARISATATDEKKINDKDLEADARGFTSNIMKKSMERELTKTTDDDRFSEFVNAITNLMDPHTDYFMPVEKRSWDEDLTGKFYGIGAVIGEENGYPKIHSVSAGGPAWKTGEVTEGDIIVKIAQGNGEAVDVAGYDVPDAVKLIRGSKGSTVVLTLRKPDGTTKNVAIVREELKLDEVFAKSSIIRQNGHKTGYIYLPKFYTSMGERGGRNCSEDIAMEVLKLKEQQVESIIIDIRDNGGGSLYEAIRMVGLFIPNGPVVQVKDNEGKLAAHGDSDNKVLYEGPLVVMVNEFSASASEIFAAAIQDYKRGVVVGSSSTYGKGTVQRPVPLSLSDDDTDGLGTIHLTIQKYYRINGASTQLKGVEPDVVLPGYYEYYKLKEKDNPSALEWDELKKLSYKPWEQQSIVDTVKQHFQLRADTSSTFTAIRGNVKWLATQAEGVRYLSLNAYKAKAKQIREKVEQTRNMMKLTHQLDIELVDKPSANDSRATERNDRWMKLLKEDVYLAEAVTISDDIVSSTQNKYAKR
jgi:carboxyl-terminal processing protease